MARFEVRITALDCPDCEQPLDEPSTDDCSGHEQAREEFPSCSIEVDALSETHIVEALELQTLIQVGGASGVKVLSSDLHVGGEDENKD